MYACTTETGAFVGIIQHWNTSIWTTGIVMWMDCRTYTVCAWEGNESVDYMTCAREYVYIKDNERQLLIYEKNHLLFVFNLHSNESYTDFKFEVRTPGKYKCILSVCLLLIVWSFSSLMILCMVVWIGSRPPSITLLSSITTSIICLCICQHWPAVYTETWIYQLMSIKWKRMNEFSKHWFVWF